MEQSRKRVRGEMCGRGRSRRPGEFHLFHQLTCDKELKPQYFSKLEITTWPPHRLGGGGVNEKCFMLCKEYHKIPSPLLRLLRSCLGDSLVP